MTHATQHPDRMTAKQRMRAVLAGQPVDRFPVAVPYIFLLQCDHWCALAGRPAWTYYDWLIQEPDEHIRAYEALHHQLPLTSCSR